MYWYGSKEEVTEDNYKTVLSKQNSRLGTSKVNDHAWIKLSPLECKPFLALTGMKQWETARQESPDTYWLMHVLIHVVPECLFADYWQLNNIPHLAFKRLRTFFFLASCFVLHTFCVCSCLSFAMQKCSPRPSCCQQHRRRRYCKRRHCSW